MLFGVVYETRIWLAFVPFLVLAAPRTLMGMQSRARP
jgi:hypothetical protein